MRGRPLTIACLVLAFFLFLGTKLVKPDNDPYKDLEGQRKSVLGQVYQKEESIQDGKEKVVLYLELDTGEKIRVYLKQGEDTPKLGTIIKASGKVRNFEKATNEGQFQAESYYQILKLSYQLNQTQIQFQSNKYDVFREGLYQFRRRLSRSFDRTLPEDMSGVMKAMLLGEKGSIDQEIKELYQRSGIAHVLAISGLHISLLGMYLYKWLKRIGLPIWIQTCLPSFFILGYGVMTGFSVSSFRAIIMFLIHMLGNLLGRTYDLLTAVSLAAVLVLLDQPLYFYSSSFQFSFGCIYGIALIVPVLTEEKPRHAFLSGAALSCATLPIQLCSYYQVPVYSVILNLLIIPLMSLLLPCGILLLLLEHIPIVSNCLAILVTGILSIYEKSCFLSGELPGSRILSGKPFLWQILIYIMILVVLLLFQKKLCLGKRWIIMFVGLLILLFPFQKWMDRGKLEICFLDVGQGDCIYVSTPIGNHYLVDGGSSTVNEVGKYRIIPFLKAKGVNRLDAVFMSHPDGDHCSGIEELLDPSVNRDIEISNIILPDVWDKKEENYQALVTLSEENGVRVQYMSLGETIVEGSFQMTCLHPREGARWTDSNEYSMVLLLEYGDFKTLLTGDVEGNGEQALYGVIDDMALGNAALNKENSRGKQSLDLTVLKVAHHGSKNSSGENLLSRLSPKIAIISCGENNRYGHPHKETIERLEAAGCQIYQTSKCGEIQVRTDGKSVELHTFLDVP